MKKRINCPFCGEEILAVAKKCKHCKEFLDTEENKGKSQQAGEKNSLESGKSDQNGSRKDFAPLIGKIHRKEKVKVNYSPVKPWGMFILMNTAICISVMIVTFGDIRFAFLALLLGAAGPFIMLLLSKFLAKMSFDIEEIDPDKFRNDNERQLYHLVKTLSAKAGLDRTPELGIYKSPDMNAFATGRNRDHSLVVFSSALIDKMDEDAIAAVAAHEIAHVANGDMLSMTIMQSVVNTIIILIDIALFFALDDRKDGFFTVIIKTIFRWIIVGICMFLGNLLLLWYSRHREFKADQLAAELINADAMIGALNTLKQDEDLEIPEEIKASQEEYATFKISNKTAALDIFSTHPSIERRIESLKAL